MTPQRTNRFLAAFGRDVELIQPHLRPVILAPGEVLCDPGERIRHVYFLHEGAVSKLAVFEDGTEIECALIGREGAVGVLSALGLRSAITRDVCHLQARALVMERAKLTEASRISPQIHDALDRYCAWKMACAIRNGACNARHTVEQRLCRWLLTCSDVLESPEIPLPQELFANMLGVQRSSVSPVLQALRNKGLISLGRSRLTLDAPDRIHAKACECYAVLKQLETEILGELGIVTGRAAA